MACYRCCECDEFKNTDVDEFYECSEHENEGMCIDCYEKLEAIDELFPGVMKQLNSLSIKEKVYTIQLCDGTTDQVVYRPKDTRGSHE